MGDAILTPFTVNPGKVTELHLNISQRNKVPVSPSDAKMRVASIAPELESFRLVDANVQVAVMSSPVKIAVGLLVKNNVPLASRSEYYWETKEKPNKKQLRDMEGYKHTLFYKI